MSVLMFDVQQICGLAPEAIPVQAGHLQGAEVLFYSLPAPP